jgi:cell wall-associated NlpC family hydrolase
MSSNARARHRAPVAARTPLTQLTESVAVNAGAAGRRAGVLAASSGLVVSLGVAAADAAPVSHHTADATSAPADATTAPAGGEPRAASVPSSASADEPRVDVSVTAPADAGSTVVGTVAGAVIAPPPPPPPPAPNPEPSPTTREAGVETSRSATRTAAPVARSAESTETLSATRANVMAVAARYVGLPYRYGGTTPSGFDCSGYTAYVFAQVGISLPRTSSAQAGAATRISREEALPGDLVFMPGHIGIYAGDGMMYDSPRTGSVVSKRPMWSSQFGFYRVIDGS